MFFFLVKEKQNKNKTKPNKTKQTSKINIVKISETIIKIRQTEKFLINKQKPSHNLDTTLSTIK